MDAELNSFLNEQAVYLEKERKKAVKFNRVYRIVKPLRTLLKWVLVFLVILNFIIPILIPLTIIVGVFYLLLLMFSNPTKVFESRLKNRVLPTIFQKVNTNFSYSPYGYNEQTLKDSQFMDKGFFSNTIRIEGEDYVKGEIENVAVEFFEIKFYREETNYTKTAGGCLLSIILLPVEIIKNIFGDNIQDEIFVGVIKDTNVFFSGFFMQADFHKEFNGKVLMIPKRNERLKNKLHEILVPKSLTKIPIENPYINDRYNIYASNPQLGYYVLSPSLIDRIHILSENEKALPIVSFIQGKMYLVIPWNKNFFSANLNIKIESGAYFRPYINEIKSFETIVKDLNLDTRIWTKV